MNTLPFVSTPRRRDISAGRTSVVRGGRRRTTRRLNDVQSPVAMEIVPLRVGPRRWTSELKRTFPLPTPFRLLESTCSQPAWRRPTTETLGQAGQNHGCHVRRSDFPAAWRHPARSSLHDGKAFSEELYRGDPDRARLADTES